MQKKLVDELEYAIHLELDFNDMILSICRESKSCHPQARFWLPTKNFERFEAYLRINSLQKLQATENGKEHIAKLIAGRIMHVCSGKQIF